MNVVTNVEQVENKFLTIYFTKGRRMIISSTFLYEIKLNLCLYYFESSQTLLYQPKTKILSKNKK